MKNSGQGLVEYALLLVLVAMVVIGALALTGDSLNEVFGRVGDELALNGDPMENPETTPVPQDITVQVVLGQESEPLGDVQVEAFDEAENLISSATTNETGETVFSELTEGRYVFRASYASQSYWSDTINVPRQTSAEISISEQSFNVHVINSQGGTLVDVPVYAFNETKAFTGIEGVTDQNGMVTFSLPDGNYLFRADYSGQETWSDAVTIPEYSSIHVRVPISDFAVRVYRHNGQTVDDVPVYAFNGEENYTGINAMSDENGIAAMELPDGQYQYRADYNGEAYWSEKVTTPGENSTSLYVGGFDVTVQVTDNTGIAISNRTVYVYDNDGNYLNLGKSTDGNGEVVFELNEGQYLFRAVGDDNKDYWSDTVDVSSETNTTIRIQRSGFVVTVTGNTQGQRIAVYVFKYYKNRSYTYTGQAKYIDQNNQAEFDIGGGKYIFLVYNFTGGRYVWSEDVKLPKQTSLSVYIP
jgi:pilus assembly protein Flp/PilA